ncbi:hypothetical protein IC582_021178 [Cucumis melo]
MTSTTTTSQCEPIVYDPMHKILDVDLNRLSAWIADKRTDDEVRETFHGKNRRYFLETCLCFAGGWRMSIWMHFFFSFTSRLRQLSYLLLKTSQLQTQFLWFRIVTLLYRILVAKWPLYKECIKENRPFDWEEEYRLVDYVVGSKEDFQDHWTSVDTFTLHSMSMPTIGFYYTWIW